MLARSAVRWILREFFPLPPPVRPHPSLVPGVQALLFISGKPWTRSKVDVAISKTRGGGEQRAGFGAKRGCVNFLGSIHAVLFLLAWAGGLSLQLGICF